MFWFTVLMFLVAAYFGYQWVFGGTVPPIPHVSILTNKNGEKLEDLLKRLQDKQDSQTCLSNEDTEESERVPDPVEAMESSEPTGTEENTRVLTDKQQAEVQACLQNLFEEVDVCLQASHDESDEEREEQQEVDATVDTPNTLNSPSENTAVTSKSS